MVLQSSSLFTLELSDVSDALFILLTDRWMNILSSTFMIILLSVVITGIVLISLRNIRTKFY